MLDGRWERAPGDEGRNAGRDTRVPVRDGDRAARTERPGFRHGPATTRLCDRHGGMRVVRTADRPGGVFGLGSRGLGLGSLRRLRLVDRRRRLNGSRNGRLGRGGRGRLHPLLRQEGERVDVAVRVRAYADAEMDVRLVVLGVAARADRPEGRALRDGGLRSDLERAEVEERDRVAVGGLHRHGSTSAGDRAGEGDDSGGRCAHGGTCRPGDVGAAVLSGGVGVVSEDEGS
jgi:hypothetical protein